MSNFDPFDPSDPMLPFFLDEFIFNEEDDRPRKPQQSSPFFPFQENDWANDDEDEE